MIDPVKKETLLQKLITPYALGGYLGLPYEEDGCLKFIKRVYADLGIDANEPEERTPVELRRDFDPVDLPEFGDVVVFQELPFAPYHVGMMLDDRWAIQSSRVTNGVGRIEITRLPWAPSLRGFYRLKCC